MYLFSTGLKKVGRSICRAAFICDLHKSSFASTYIFLSNSLPSCSSPCNTNILLLYALHLFYINLIYPYQSSAHFLTA